MARPVLRSVSVRPSTRRNSRRSGFTLVELAVVVAIIGILAVLAIVGYRKYILYTKTSEAINTLGAIKIAQEDHRAEKGTYADLGVTWCPPGAGGPNTKINWVRACGGGIQWDGLPVHIEGAVQFQYATVGGVSGFDGSTIAGWATWTGANVNVPWYVAAAKCDLDGDATTTSDFATASQTNRIFSQNEGL